MRHSILAAILLAGCASAPQWVNAKNPSADLAADTWACDKEVSAVLANQQRAQPRPAAPTRYSTECQSYGSTTNCETTAGNGGDIGSASAAGFAMGQAAAMPARLKNSCMAARGWAQVKG